MIRNVQLTLLPAFLPVPVWSLWDVVTLPYCIEEVILTLPLAKVKADSWLS